MQCGQHTFNINNWFPFIPFHVALATLTGCRHGHPSSMCGREACGWKIVAGCHQHSESSSNCFLVGVVMLALAYKQFDQCQLFSIVPDRPLAKCIRQFKCSKIM